MTWTKDSLIAFERRVEQAFLDKRIRAPVHLSGGNEDQLIEVFKDVRPGDWVFSTWRSHYHALLKGISEEWVWNEVLAGRSMYLNNAEHRFLSSAIVGGMLPIACGVAMGIKRWNSNLPYFKGGIRAQWQPDEYVGNLKSKVWVFVGDMTARTGLFHEFEEYVVGHDLPVAVVIEDNGLSTNTPTAEAWGKRERDSGWWQRYKYERTYPHVGVGKHVQF